jgi:CHAT domain-containing protein/metallo-beta-lactamase superfamily protein
VAEELQIRTVRLELLRAGPPHNQLLSPLTQYLAICGESGAGVVNLPYEHETFERRLKELRYDAGDREDRLPVLRETGVDMAKILGSVPGVTGSLGSDQDQQGTLVHLRIILSASELALLPFELSKVPMAANMSNETWLAVQTRPPVCITRHIRTVSTEGLTWPERPRILFVAGDPSDIPFNEHLAVLEKAVEPFLYPGKDERKQTSENRIDYGDWMTVLTDVSLDDLVTTCSSAKYTHVHVLAHGAADETTSGRPFGLRLRGADGEPEIVSGDQFASALAVVNGGQHRPAVVTLASCDSGNVGQVVVPGASFAHALHQSGITLVVASQFPLTKEGSVTVASILYPGLLWGDNPWVLLHRVRSELHSRYGATSHDWASLVAYEAFPSNLLDQLQMLRYKQARQAINAALEGVDQMVKESVEDKAALDTAKFEARLAGVAAAAERLPSDGNYAMECLGLQGSSQKRLAAAQYLLASADATQAKQHLDSNYSCLESAFGHYQRAVRGFLVNEGRPVQREATLHWVLVQQLSLAAVLGTKHDEGKWLTALLAAELYRDHAVHTERAWARGSLAELYLLRLANPDLDEQEREHARAEALRYAEELSQMYPWEDAFPVRSTRVQFRRFFTWWGQTQFSAGLASRGRTQHGWDAPNGLLETAAALFKILERPLAAGRAGSAVPISTRAVVPAQRVTRATADAPPTGRFLRSAGARRDGARRRDGSFIDVEMLPAQHGDCLWLEYGDSKHTSRLLVDCGTKSTFPHLQARAAQVPARQRSLELLVMTHIDADHIGGAIPFLQANLAGLTARDVWFNGWRHISGYLNAKQGEIFSTLIRDQKLAWNAWQDGGPIVVGDDLPTHELPGGLKLTLLSPTPARLKALARRWKSELEKEGLVPGAKAQFRRFLAGTRSTSRNVDALAAEAFEGDGTAPNGSSIALLAEFGGVSVLLGADAHSPVLVESIRKLLQKRKQKRLPLDGFKLPHHGSKNNVSREVLELVDCRNYLFSTNGDTFYHPDRQAVARVIKYGGKKPRLHFNYRSDENAVWSEPALREKFTYEAVYPDQGRAGLAVRLT